MTSLGDSEQVYFGVGKKVLTAPRKQQDGDLGRQTKDGMVSFFALAFFVCSITHNVVEVDMARIRGCRRYLRDIASPKIQDLSHKTRCQIGLD